MDIGLPHFAHVPANACRKAHAPILPDRARIWGGCAHASRLAAADPGHLFVMAEYTRTCRNGRPGPAMKGETGSKPEWPAPGRGWSGAGRPPAAGLMSREEFMRLIARAAVIAAGLALVAMSSTSAAWAQQPSRLRGQIEKADGAMLTLKTRDGGTLNV